MGLLDKFKDMFTEEIEEEPVKRETRYSEPKKVEEPVRPAQPKIQEEKQVQTMSKEIEEEPVPPKEDKFVFFSDDDFKDLEKPKKEDKKVVEKRQDRVLAYKGAVPQTRTEPKKNFQPSPIISPVYGVLDKNYSKEDIIEKKSQPRVYRSSTITIDDVRNKAYGTLEDEISDDMLGKALIEQKPIEKEADINIFEELDKYSEDEVIEPVIISHSTDDVDEIFGKLDDKKEEILDELDNKKEEILDEIDNKKESIDLLTDDYKSKKIASNDDILEENSIEIEEDTNNNIDDNSLDDNVEDKYLDEDTDALAKELENQKKKLEEINSMMEDNEKVTKKKTKKKKESTEDLNESELFDIIDSMYESDGEE